MLQLKNINWKDIQSQHSETISSDIISLNFTFTQHLHMATWLSCEKSLWTQLTNCFKGMVQVRQQKFQFSVLRSD